MSSFTTAFTAVSPMLVYMIVGKLVRQAGICSTDTLKAINQLIFRVFIPLSLFISIYNSDFGQIMQPGLMLYAEVLLILACVVTWFLFRPFVPDKADHATLTQGIFRGNMVLFGSALAANLCDDAGVALAAAMCAVVVPTINIEGVILFEMIRGNKVQAKSLLISILKNPLVAAGILGIAFSLLHIPLPSFIIQPLTRLGNAATPVALVVLGGLISMGSIRSHKWYLIIAFIGKLILFPLIAILIGLLLGYRGNEIVVLTAVFGAPTAVASAPMAQAMGGNGDLAGEIVAVTSAGCLVTLFLFILVLSAAGII